MRIRLIALAGACAALIAPAAAQAQNPLSSIFSCENPNNRQQGGAIAGALLGGLLGNQINDNDRTTGTVVGGLLGAAAGSAVGCRMTSADTSRATDATRQALETGRSTTWRNPSNGTSGRIDIVDTYDANRAGDRNGGRYDNRNDNNYNDRNDGRYGRNDDRNSYGPQSLSDVRFSYGVAQPGSNYRMLNEIYQAKTRVNVRNTASLNSRVLSTLSTGEQFTALATIDNRWLLVGRGNEAIGYVSTDVVTRIGPASANYAYDDRRTDRRNDRSGRNDRYEVSQTCRVFDQTVSRNGYSPATQRYTACQSNGGEWVIQS